MFVGDACLLTLSTCLDLHNDSICNHQIREVFAHRLPGIKYGDGNIARNFQAQIL